MADDTKSYPLLTTPPGEAHWAHLAEPDTVGQYADGKYKVEVSWPKSTPLDGLKALFREAAELEWGEDVEFLSPIRDGDAMYDSKGNLKDDYQGQWVLSLKSKFQPMQYDEQGNAIPDLANMGIRAGDTIMASAVVKPYYNAKDRERGITLYLRELQRVAKGNKSFGTGGESAFAGKQAPEVAGRVVADEDSEPPF